MQVLKANFQEQSYEDFSNRFHKAELLDKGDKGLIFVGNTRVGKSTLSSAAAGSKMELFYNAKLKQTVIRPIDEKFKDLVNDNLTSVTEQPNFFKVPNKYAIIDMPGYADSSRFRELINFHYIRTMTKNLKEVRFLMVITVGMEDGKFTIDSHELKMMENFMEMFPECSQNLSLIINKIDSHITKEIEQNLRAFLNEMFLQGSEVSDYVKKYVKNYAALRTYFMQPIGKGKFHAVRRPPFKSNPNKQGDWSEPYNEIKATMQKICNQKSIFFSTKQLSKINVSIFKPEQPEANEKILKMVLNFLDRIDQNVEHGIMRVKELLVKILGRELQKQKIILSKDILGPFLKTILVKHEHYRQLKQFEDQKLIESTYVKIIDKICQFISLYNEDYSKYESQWSYDNYLKMVENKEIIQIRKTSDIFGGLLRIGKQIGQKDKDLVPNLKELFSFLVRSIEEAFFMWKVASNEIKQNGGKSARIMEDYDTNENKKPTLIGQISYKCKTIIERINKVFIMDGDLADNFERLLTKLLDFFLNLDIYRYVDIADQHLEKELIEDLEIIKSQYSIFAKGQKLSEEIELKINNKINEIKTFFIIMPCPPNPSPEKLFSTLKRLLQEYPFAKTKQIKFKIAVKVAVVLQHLKEPKKAIGLYFHLQIFQKVMRLLSEIAQGKEMKKADAIEWYLEFGKQFLNKKQSIYFQICMEKAKSFSLEEVNKLIQIQEQLVRGKLKLKDQQFSAQSFDKPTLSGKVEYWNWFRIDQEIGFLRSKEGLEANGSNVLAKKYREGGKSPLHNLTKSK